QEKEIGNFLNRIKEINDRVKESSPLYKEGKKASQENDFSNFLNKNKELIPLYQETVQEIQDEIDWYLTGFIEREDPFYEEAKIKMQKREYKEQKIIQAFLDKLGHPVYRKTMNYYKKLVINY